MAKISVVGAGPAGSIVANTLSQDNDVFIFEEHKEQPVNCAGLISKSGLKQLDIKSDGFVLNTVRGAKMVSPTDKSIEIRAKGEKAFVIDRKEFDRDILNKAIDSGATLVNERVTDVNGCCVKYAGKELDVDKVVLATGTDYTLSKKLGLDTPDEFLIGAQYEMKVECDPDMVELHFIVPDFFAWIIPVDGYARVGLCTKSNPTHHLDTFVKRLKSQGRISNDRILAKNFGVIPVYNPKLRTQYEDIFLVGDAASHVKATTGGGIILGGMAAKLVGAGYERAWKKTIGRELYLHLLIRKFVNRLSPKGVNLLFSVLEDARQTLEEDGDMDMASKNILAVVQNTRFLVKFMASTPLFFMDILSNNLPWIPSA